MRNLSRYILPEQIPLDGLLKKIGEKFQVIEGLQSKRSLEYYDTFDWRLYLNGLLLLKDTTGYRLMSLDEKSTVASLKWLKKVHPKFWQDFPENLLQTKLKSIIGVRALLPVVVIKRELRNFKINTTPGRNIASLSVEDYKMDTDQSVETFVRVLVLNQVGNVFSEYLELQGIMRSFSITPVEDIYKRCLSAAGKIPGAYKSKIEISIDPQMPAAKGAKEILKLLFDVMLKNEEGIKKNIDIEFLHDYRVAVRRTRTIFGQLKGIFPPVVVSGLKNEFSKLGKLSNEARDLDVYLLRKNEYEQMLPEYFEGSLEPLFELLKKRCTTEHNKLVRQLKSESYSEFKNSYITFLNNDTLEMQNVDNSKVSIGKLATAAILNKYTQVIEYGNNITKNSPDEDLHRLRIECKKLRYLLELFSSIYSPKKVDSLIAQLKKLQTNLGDFNDMYVQQKSLCEYLESIIPGQKGSIKAASAIGGLITHLHCERKKVRKAFKKTFVLFYKSSSKKIQKNLDVF